ncbi:MAG: hypothetical protein ACI4DV_04045 [Lachnospiraceae bacterium]
MNTYWKIILLFLTILITGRSENCLAAEPTLKISCDAVWESEEERIAKVTLHETDHSAAEYSLGTTDYIFMIDGSRTTTLNDSYLKERNTEESEPLSVHCPCMAQGHYYRIDSRCVLPITHTLGYLKDTHTLISWSAERKIWSDSAGAHFDEKDRKIPVRYESGCKDIFTLYKEAAIETIREIAQRADGSRVAFLSYSASDGSIYGVTEYTSDYEKAIEQIRKTGFLPGSVVAPGLEYAKILCQKPEGTKYTKIFIMGDGRQNDIEKGVAKAKELRELTGVTVYSACMGIESYIKGSGYRAMRQMTGNQDDHFFAMIRTGTENLKDAFSAVCHEKTKRSVEADNKQFTWSVSSDCWEVEYDELKNYRCSASAGTADEKNGCFIWTIPKESRNNQCTFYLRLKEEAKAVAQKTAYPAAGKLQCTYMMMLRSKP